MVPLEDVEQAVAGLKDVVSSRIVAGDDGGIVEVHVVADSARSAKQVARDVESMIVSKLGLQMDHRKISVAQIDDPAEPAGDPAPTQTATAPEPHAGFYLAASERRIEFVGVSLAQSHMMAEARVELERDGIATVAEASGADSSESVLRMIADATIQAVQRFYEDGGLFSVTAVEQTTVGGKPIVVASVAHVSERHERSLIGACPVNGDVQRAVALATLDAVNRFLRRLEPKEPTDYEIGPAS